MFVVMYCWYLRLLVPTLIHLGRYYSTHLIHKQEARLLQWDALAGGVIRFARILTSCRVDLTVFTFPTVHHMCKSMQPLLRYSSCIHSAFVSTKGVYRNHCKVRKYVCSDFENISQLSSKHVHEQLCHWTSLTRWTSQQSFNIWMWKIQFFAIFMCFRFGGRG